MSESWTRFIRNNVVKSKLSNSWCAGKYQDKPYVFINGVPMRYKDFSLFLMGTIFSVSVKVDKKASEDAVEATESLERLLKYHGNTDTSKRIYRAIIAFLDVNYEDTFANNVESILSKLRKIEQEMEGVN